MTFENISDSQANQIEKHYIDMRGEAKAFKLSTTNLSGVQDTAWQNYNWRYAAPITIGQTTALRMTVSVS